jgi:drug/metabolite transporter (DMT)-like permease
MPFTSDAQPTPPAPQLNGVLSMLGAVAVFSCMDVTMKQLSESYPAVQVTFVRGAAALPFLLANTARSGNWRELRPQRWSLHLLRGVLGFVTLYGFIWSVGKLSLAHTYAIFMSAPLWITALSWALLRERVAPQRWLAVLLGLAGVVLALKPAGEGFTIAGGLGALGAALGYALSAITIRVQGRTESAAATVLWGLLITTLLSGSLALSGWVAMRWPDVPWVVALGVTGAIGQSLLTRAFQSAPPQVVAPLEYTALLWGLLFDALLWQAPTEGRVLLGAAIVIGSGVYVITSAARAAHAR